MKILKRGKRKYANIGDEEINGSISKIPDLNANEKGLNVAEKNTETRKAHYMKRYQFFIFLFLTPWK